MMRHFPDAAEPKSFRTTTIVAIAALALIAACGTGIAALFGLLPESENVAVTVTTIPLVDIWRNESSPSIRPQSESRDSGMSVE
ncbi:hypothetical protein [Paraburkholderia caribensis]|nr:hypothetical protein [Paraburkholderia caribensis]